MLIMIDITILKEHVLSSLINISEHLIKTETGLQSSK